VFAVRFIGIARGSVAESAATESVESGRVTV